MKRLGTAMMTFSLTFPVILVWVWALSGMTLRTFLASVFTLFVILMTGAVLYSKEAPTKRRQ